LSSQVYNLLMEKVELDEEEEEQCQSSSSQKGKAIEQVRKQSSGLTSGGESTVKRNGPPSPGIERSIEDAFDKMKQCVITRNDEQDTSSPRMGVYVERTIEPAASSVSLDSRYLRLAELGRQQATVNRPYGLDRTRGHDMRRLWRIATDSKIFAERVPMKDYKPFEVVILLDTSGSMLGPLTFLSSESRSLVASQAVYGAAHGLAEARCQVAVYAHTASKLGLDEVNIYTLKTFNEPTTLLGHRLEELHDKYEYAGDNRDGFAITYVARKFRTASRRRILIVVSDGYPNAAYYKGEVGIYHTEQAVAAVRRQGIEVLSISIAQDAAKANDRIYGKENNVFNTDPNVIESIVRRYITQ
jgi:cobalamin biosynthesis protein CobT